MKIRNGNINDLTSVKRLGQNTWKHFKKDLTPENWDKLYNSLLSIDTMCLILRRYGISKT